MVTCEGFFLHPGLETTSHFLLRFQLFQIAPRTLLNDIKKTDEQIKTDHKNYLDQILLHGNERYKYDANRIILLSTITFCVRFDLPLF